MIHCDLLPTDNGLQLGVLKLDSAARLNAQTLAMVRAMNAALRLWRENDAVVAVLLVGVGPRGFCAGGDLKALYHAMTAPGAMAEGDAFFAEEYGLCRDLRAYPKPVLAWGQGIVMGGGWGLFAGAHHRIVTESTRLAMPEISIGLFPDVGASRWLHELPANLGRWLALTASELNAADAVWSGAAQVALPDALRPQLKPWLQALPWQANPDLDAILLREALGAWAAAQPCAMPARRWAPLAERIEALCAGTLPEIADRLRGVLDTPDFGEAAGRFYAGSPTSAWLIRLMEDAARGLDYDAIWALETRIAYHALRIGDFREGIRAKLVERDGLPHWRARALHGEPPEDIVAMTASTLT
ncbi:enoyl-CoA hydratase/isomerase family protein [Chitinolyticbacter albus]|uniref:enoyl-CoA hydratase/isomerase family protein n=1 Tax=Chitinolyticbacter albus TaxID=2961951 RepID=UPI00210D1A7F|nr:enoyl-CoA hydratase/isomerase family protein [Chitinolyticbacter albus]